MASLLEQLAREGCENTVLAVGGSLVHGRLIPVVERPLYELTADETAWEYGPFEQAELLDAIARAPDHDVIHSHVGWSGWVLSGIEAIADRVLHTLHNPVTPDLVWFAARHPDLRLSCVSEYQATKLRQAGATRCQVVYNGLDFSRFPLRIEGKQGLVYLGRVEREKGTDLAIATAQALQMPLTIAGPAVDHEFFDAQIRPLLGDQVRYVGVVEHEQKVSLLGGASCVLMPSRDEEGFGLVALEAMACGTPVAALASGALPEVVEDGVTGSVSSGPQELVTCVSRAMTLEPAAVRARAERRFSVGASAAAYLELYRELARTTTPHT